MSRTIYVIITVILIGHIYRKTDDLLLCILLTILFILLYYLFDKILKAFKKEKK